MTVYYNRARKRWMYDFELGGKRFAGYCLDATSLPVRSKSAAKQAEAVERRRAAAAPQAARAGDVTFAEVVATLSPNWANEADAENKDRYARELLKFFGPQTPVESIGDIRVQEYVRWSREQPILVWCGGSTRKRNDPRAALFWRAPKNPKHRTPATINLYLHLLRQIFKQALKMRDEATGEPLIKRVPEVKDLDVPKRKARPVPEKILGEAMASVPQHILEAMTATLFFGFRRSEVFTLQIRHVDLELGGIRFLAEEVKDDEDDFLPGAPEAMAFMRRMVEQAENRGTTYLFPYRPYRKDPNEQAGESWRPMKSPKRAWKTAMKKVAAKHGVRYRWHDIRAAFITHVAVTSGGVAAQALARHSDYETTLAYIHVADDVKRAAAVRAAVRPALSAASLESPKQESQTHEASELETVAK